MLTMEMTSWFENLTWPQAVVAIVITVAVAMVLVNMNRG